MESDKNKRYAQLSTDSIRKFAESIGYSELTQQILSAIVDDSSYVIRQAVCDASQFMKHSGRQKLTTSDMDRALWWSDVPPVYGHSGDITQGKYTYSSKDRKFALEETEIDLVLLSTSNSEYKFTATPSVSVEWLSLEGIPVPNYPSSDSAAVVKVPLSLSEDQACYYELMRKAILGNDSVLLKIAIDDLQSNPRLSPMLSHFVNFVHDNMTKVINDVTQQRKLLMVVDSLLSNSSLYIGHEPYLKLLIDSVLHCILSPVGENETITNDHWVLKDCGANVLAKVLSGWIIPANSLYQYILECLRKAVQDFRQLSFSQYGAVAAVIACGPCVIMKILYPHISSFIPYLNDVLKDCTYKNAKIRNSAIRVYDLLLKSCEVLLTSVVKVGRSKSCLLENTNFSEQSFVNNSMPSASSEITGSMPVSKMYKEFYNYFGDSLLLHLACFEGKYQFQGDQFRAPVTVPLFSETMHLKTGMELLEDIYKTDITVAIKKDEDSRIKKEAPAVDTSCEAGSSETVEIYESVQHPEDIGKLIIKKVRYAKSNASKSTGKRSNPFEDRKPAPKKKADSSSLSSKASPVAKETNSNNSHMRKNIGKRYVKPETKFYRKLLTGNLEMIL